MDDRPVESSQFSCARFGKETQIDIYSILKPIIHGTVLPATMVREMHCQNENNCGIAASFEGPRRYFWHLCPASDIFLKKGTFLPSSK